MHWWSRALRGLASEQLFLARGVTAMVVLLTVACVIVGCCGPVSERSLLFLDCL
jgi:hypothetical protein